MKVWKFTLLLFLYPSIIFSQTPEAGDIFDKITTIINGLPGEGSNEYVEPTGPEQTAWLDMLADLFTGFYADAALAATALDYVLVQFTDTPTGSTYYVLEKTGGGMKYWGTYILNPAACRFELVLMAPHPKKDFNTGKQAIYCFQELDAYFFMLPGTNRCNQTNHSSCSGMTEVCSGMNENFRTSDMAHVTEAIWQRTTEYVYNNSSAYFVQLHGFAQTAGDPYVIMSNGTRITPNPDKIIELKTELEIVDPVLDFKIAHVDLAWDRLIGFTNTNGRYINGVANVCDDNAVGTSGRFLHVEQEKTRLRDNITGWNKMGVALGETFNQGGCPSLPLLPVELAYFKAELVGDQVLLKWETFSENNNDYFAIERSLDGSHFTEIGRVPGKGTQTTESKYEHWDSPTIGQNYYRLRQVDFDGGVEFSPTRMIHFTDKNPFPILFLENGNVVINMANLSEGEFFLFNPVGQLLSKSKLGEGRNVFQLHSSSLGVCFYKIALANGQTETGKFWHE